MEFRITNDGNEADIAEIYKMLKDYNGFAQVYDIPFANNKATADFLIHSTLMDEEYDHDVINFKKNIEHRAETLL